MSVLHLQLAEEKGKQKDHRVRVDRAQTDRRMSRGGGEPLVSNI
jgi:hypothetical protein